MIVGGREISTDVTELDLTGWGLTDEDIVALGRCTRLTRLNLGSGSNEDGNFVYHCITDLSPLAGLTELIHLNLAGNSIADLSPLADLTELCKLNLSGNTLSDVAPLLGLDKLRSLAVVECGLSPEREQQLADALTDCNIYFADDHSYNNSIWQ